MTRQAVRAGLYETMAEEVESLCGPRYRPDSGCSCHRAGSEKGVAYFEGGKEEIRRPRVRHEDEGEVEPGSYRAASSPRNLFGRIVDSLAQGLPQRGQVRSNGKAVGKSAVSSRTRGMGGKKPRTA